MLATELLRVQIFSLIICLATSDINWNFTLGSREHDTPTLTLPHGYIRHSNVRSAYKISAQTAAWPSARQACIVEGGRLAVIDTSEKMEYLKSQRIGIPHVWVGIYRESYVGHWSAVDQSTISGFLPWGHLFENGVTRNCVAMVGGTPGLRNFPCNQGKKFACEIPDAN